MTNPSFLAYIRFFKSGDFVSPFLTPAIYTEIFSKDENNYLKKKKKPMPLRTYAASVLRWRNEEKDLLQSDENIRLQRGRMLLEKDIEARRAVKEFASDRTVDGLIAKAGVNLVNSILNEKSEWTGSAMSVKPVRVYFGSYII